MKQKQLEITYFCKNDWSSFLGLSFFWFAAGTVSPSAFTVVAAIASSSTSGLYYVFDVNTFIYFTMVEMANHRVGHGSKKANQDCRGCSCQNLFTCLISIPKSHLIFKADTLSQFQKFTMQQNILFYYLFVRHNPSSTTTLFVAAKTSNKPKIVVQHEIRD